MKYSGVKHHKAYIEQYTHQIYLGIINQRSDDLLLALEKNSTIKHGECSISGHNIQNRGR